MTSGSRWKAGALAGACCLIAACGGAAPPAACTPGADTGWMTEPFATVSRYCQVRIAGGEVVPFEGVVPYDLNTPLFTDRAVKRRTVFVPKGQAAAYDPSEPLAFPVGSVVTKSFGVRDDLRKASPKVRWAETRVMVRRPDGWTGWSYKWNDAQTEAALFAGGGVETVSWIDETGATETANYLYPSAVQCKGCHEFLGTMTLLGPRARNLNRDFAYADGTENQLARWSRTGLLTGAPAPSAAPRLPVWNDPSTGSLEQRARAYLEVNCAHCHGEKGAARTTGLWLYASETDPGKLGTCKQPVAAGPGAGGLKFDVVPGKPDESILPYRLSINDAGLLMPQIGRSVVDRAGLQLVRDWIAAMPGACP